MIICAVVVTYNRLDKLKKCLSSYSDQTRKPDKLIVVDNASNQETKDYLNQWKEFDDGYEKFVLTLDKNYGGSGGFYYGMKKADELGFDWLWIADDDAYLDHDCFELLEKEIHDNPNLKAICSQVNNANGIDFAHRRLIKKGRLYPKEVDSDSESYTKNKFSINLFSFVGTALNKEVVEQCGFPRKDFFIWFDDTEYSYRVNEKFNIECFPLIKVFHDDIQKGVKNTISWKTYYGERNRLETFRLHFSKREFSWYLLRYKLAMIKSYFTNHKLYMCKKDALYDFCRNRFGISDKYKPGKGFK